MNRFFVASYRILSAESVEIIAQRRGGDNIQRRFREVIVHLENRLTVRSDYPNMRLKQRTAQNTTSYKFLPLQCLSSLRRPTAERA